MKRKRSTKTQIFSILKEFDAGKNIQNISVSKATIYNLKAKYSGMEMNELKKYNKLEEKNRKFKQMYTAGRGFTENSRGEIMEFLQVSRGGPACSKRRFVQ